MKFDPYLTPSPRATPILDPRATILAVLKEHHTSIISTKFRRNRLIGSREDLLRICAIFRWRPSWIMRQPPF